MASWPLDLGGGKLGAGAAERTPELELQRSRARAGAEHRTSGAVEPNAGHREPAGGLAFLLAAGSGVGPWATFLQAWLAWAAALASSSRIGKWLPRHFARYDETWRNRQTLGWAMDGYRLTACAALRDVGDFG